MDPTTTADERFDAALAAALPAEEPEAPPEEPTTPPDEPEAEAPEPEEPPAEEPPPKKGSLAWRWAETRKKEKALEQERAGLDAQLAEARTMLARMRADEQQVKTVTQLLELARTQPDRAFASIAQMAGVSEQALYERITRAKLREPGQQTENPELAELREEIRAMRAEQQRRAEEAEKEQHQTAYETAVSTDVEAVAKLADYPDRWPHASEWPIERIRHQARAFIREIHKRGLASSVKEVADRIEAVAQYEEETRTKVRASRGSPPQKGDGRGLPEALEASKPAGRAPRSSLGNRDAANGAGARQLKTFDDVFDAAVREYTR